MKNKTKGKIGKRAKIPIQYFPFQLVPIYTCDSACTNMFIFNIFFLSNQLNCCTCAIESMRFGTGTRCCQLEWWKPWNRRLEVNSGKLKHRHQHEEMRTGLVQSNAGTPGRQQKSTDSNLNLWNYFVLLQITQFLHFQSETLDFI